MHIVSELETAAIDSILYLNTELENSSLSADKFIACALAPNRGQRVL